MSPEPGLSAPLRVVIVDDTPDLRDLLTLALQRRGEYQVVAEADNGRDAIDVVGREQPDVVLLDIAMPVMDGLEALPHIRQVCARATVVMLSGFGAHEMSQRALSLGADGYVQKGAPLRELLAQVRGHVEGTARSRGTTLPPARLTQDPGTGLPDRAATTPEEPPAAASTED